MGEPQIYFLYVDDIIVTCVDHEEMVGLKNYLVKEFDIKDLGNLRYFLGIELTRF